MSDELIARERPEMSFFETKQSSLGYFATVMCCACCCTTLPAILHDASSPTCAYKTRGRDSIWSLDLHIPGERIATWGRLPLHMCKISDCCWESNHVWRSHVPNVLGRLSFRVDGAMVVGVCGGVGKGREGKESAEKMKEKTWDEADTVTIRVLSGEKERKEIDYSLKINLRKDFFYDPSRRKPLFRFVAEKRMKSSS